MSGLTKKDVHVCILFDSEIRDCAVKYTLFLGQAEDDSVTDRRQLFHDFSASFQKAFRDLIESPNDPIAFASQDSRLHEELMRAVAKKSRKEKKP